MTTINYVRDLKSLVEKTKEILSMVNSEFGFKAEKVLETYELMFDRFCPFKVGDRVCLAPGVSFKIPGGEVLQERSPATVINRTYDALTDSFAFGIEFDDDHWIDTKGEKHLIEPGRRFVYRVLESQIVSQEL